MTDEPIPAEGTSAAEKPVEQNGAASDLNTNEQYYFARTSHSRQRDREELIWDKWMHRTSCWAGSGAVIATSGLAGVGLAAAFVGAAAVAAPVTIPALGATAAGLAVYAVGSKLMRHFMASGSRKHWKVSNGYFCSTGITRRFDYSDVGKKYIPPAGGPTKP